MKNKYDEVEKIRLAYKKQKFKETEYIIMSKKILIFLKLLCENVFSQF